MPPEMEDRFWAFMDREGENPQPGTSSDPSRQSATRGGVDDANLNSPPPSGAKVEEEMDVSDHGPFPPFQAGRVTRGPSTESRESLASYDDQSGREIVSFDDSQFSVSGVSDSQFPYGRDESSYLALREARPVLSDMERAKEAISSAAGLVLQRQQSRARTGKWDTELSVLSAPDAEALRDVRVLPSTLPISRGLATGYETCNKVLRGGDPPKVTEPYVPSQVLLDPRDVPSTALGHKRYIPVDIDMGMRSNPPATMFHGTAIQWVGSSPDMVKAIGGDCLAAGTGVSFMEQAITAVLTVVKTELRKEQPDLFRVRSFVDDITPGLIETFAKTAYHCARGHCNSNLYQRDQVRDEVTGVAVGPPCWIAILSFWKFMCRVFSSVSLSLRRWFNASTPL